MREILCSGQARSLEFPYPGGMAALCWSPAGERGELTVSLHYDGAYGMGEKYNAVNQKGHTAVNEVEEKFCFQGENLLPGAFLLDKYGLRAICGHG